jgi:hypothetical protein
MNMQRRVTAALIITASVMLSAGPSLAAEQDADAISATIQQRHLPTGVIMDPIFASPTSDQIVNYTRGGDSAIWTGHYLAAEAFRYQVTGDADAFSNVQTALNGIRSLRLVTGTNLLARALMPTDWPYASSIATQEAANGIFNGTIDGVSYDWVGNTSRDEYCGVFFGLGVAYDMVDDPGVKTFIQTEATELLSFLLKTGWTVIMPNFSISTSFLSRPDEMLSILQVASHINPAQFDSTYQSYRGKFGSLLAIPIAVDCSDVNSSYFKFNLDEICFYNLIRLETSSKYLKRYLKAYMILYDTVKNHGNAHFNMIARGVMGPNSTRDQQTSMLLDQWLERPRRDPTVNWTGKFPACGDDTACSPLPVPDRVPTDFLWQRSPFQLSGGGAGTIETAGIDYILPYWMARYYQVVSD